MKKLLLILTVLAGAAFTTSCEGPQGPPGRPGPGELANVYEYTNINFDGTKTSDGILINHPQTLMLGDAVLIYFLEKVYNNEPVWSPLPYFATPSTRLGKKTIQYKFNYAPKDFELGASSDVTLENFANTDDGSFIKNLTFRVVYIPANNPIRVRSISSSNKTNSEEVQELHQLTYKELVKKYNLKESNVIRQHQ